jgi:uncharacterized protein YcfL
MRIAQFFTALVISTLLIACGNSNQDNTENNETAVVAPVSYNISSEESKLPG